MNRFVPWLGILTAVLLGGFVAFVGSQGGPQLGGISVFALCVALAFAIQWVVFLPAYIRQSEHFFDLTGSLTFVSLTLMALVASGESGVRSLLIAAAVLIWSVRLGLFLSARIRARGFDRRFATIKPDFGAFLMTWTLQGLWVSLTFAPGLAAITSTSTTQSGLDAWLLLGGVLWLLGFCLEVVADRQKRRFRADADNEDRFIQTGLWAWCQHPNYFGEILLWTGVAVMAYPALQGWQHATLISPIFVWLLLTRISGTRLLDASAEKSWGQDSDYNDYIARTPKLIPRPPRRNPTP